MILLSPAKINIGLHILRKRTDGFHDISTVMFPIPFNDIIELNLAGKNEDEFSLEQTGTIVPDEIESNLCYKAWNLFCKKAGPVSVKIHLHKRIPLGSGLGGGSSNATTVLKGLNKLTGNKLTTEKIHELASQLGSDCNLFVENRPALAEGRGELLRDSLVDLKGFHIALLHPGVSVNTAWAYGKSTSNENREDLGQLLKEPIEKWKLTVINDFEPVVFKEYPQIASLKAKLYLAGATYTAMSGSGSVVYGLFREVPILQSELKKYLIWEGSL